MKYKEQQLDKKLQRLMKTEEKLNLIINEENTKHKQQEKMYEEALDAIHKDIDNLNQENKSLKEKITEAQQNSGAIGGIVTSDIAALPSELVSAEIASLRAALRYVHNENAHLKGMESERKLLETLPKLNVHVLRKSSTAESNNVSTSDDLVKCNREVSNLIKDLQEKRVSLKVVDLNNKTIPVVQQLHTAKSDLELIQNQFTQIRNKLKLSSVTVSGNTGEIGSRSSTRIMRPKKFGQIRIPKSKTEIPLQRNSQVILDAKQFEAIHAVFVQ